MTTGAPKINLMEQGLFQAEVNSRPAATMKQYYLFSKDYNNNLFYNLSR